MKAISSSVVLFFVGMIGVSANHSLKTESNFNPGYSWGKITGIELKNSSNVVIRQGKEIEVRVDKGNGVSDVSVITEKNKLIIGGNSDNFNTGKGSTVYITVKDIHQLISSGEGDITLNGPFVTDNIELRVNGSGNINANLDTKNLKLSISGSGDLEVTGETDASDIKISGSGNVNGKELKTSTSTIVITGSGSSTVNVVDELTINITGSGNVYFLEYPERMNARSKSVGQVEKIKA